MQRRLPGYVMLALVTAAVGCAGKRSQSVAGPPVEVLRNGVVVSSPAGPFRFQDFNEPLLEELARRERLREVINPRASQFDQIRQLREWVAAQWREGTPDPYPPWNAITILDWIRSGKTGGHCGQYSQVMLQAAAALGFTARFVEIGSEVNPYAHYVTEVWSNDFNKWVVMDANYNSHFEKNGVPLSALEIHDELLAGLARTVRVDRGKMRKGHANPSRWPLKTVELYYYVRYHLKADQLTKANDPPMDRFNDMIEFDDSRTVPWEATTVETEISKERLTRQRTSDRSLLTPLLNQIQTDARLDGDGVTITARESVLQFREYEYRVIGRKQPTTWTRQAGAVLHLPMPASRETVEVRGVNVRGVSGPAAVVVLRGRPVESSQR